MIDNTVFLNGILSEISDIVSCETLNTIKYRLGKYIDDYTIEQKNMSVALRDDKPTAYKHFLVSKKIEGLSDKTIQSYKQHLDVFFQYVTYPLDKITSQTIQAFMYDYSRQIHGTAQTVPTAHTMNQYQAILNSFFGWCASNGYISKNPCEQLSKIKYRKKEIDVLSEQQIKQIKQAACKIGTVTECKRAYAIVCVLLSTGVRVGELINLKLPDIQWDSVTEGVIPVKIENGKGGKDRTVYLNQEGAVAVMDYMNYRRSDSEYLFVRTTNGNGQITTRTVQNIISRLGDMIGVSNCHPHQLRHSIATEMAKNDTPINLVQKMLGHSSTVVTTKYYIKAEEKQLAKEVKKNEDLENNKLS